MEPQKNHMKVKPSFHEQGCKEPNHGKLPLKQMQIQRTNPCIFNTPTHHLKPHRNGRQQLPHAWGGWKATLKQTTILITDTKSKRKLK